MKKNWYDDYEIYVSESGLMSMWKITCGKSTSNFNSEKFENKEKNE